ncbi:MAG TPA: helix-turn-helix domain-containing protein [Terriglobales bacterium]|jgi:excisionase family DNA binding protein
MNSAASLLTPKETAEILRVSKSYIYFLAGSGQLASLKIGKKILFSRATIDAVLKHGLPDSNIARYRNAK